MYKVFIGKNACEERWDGSGRGLAGSSDHRADLIPVKEVEKTVLGCSAVLRESARLSGRP